MGMNEHQVIVSKGETSIRDRIFTVRGVQVMLDRDLASVYNVSTSAFNQAVKRNSARFPPEFMFQLTRDELRGLMSQIVISKREAGAETRGGVRKLPYAFTEQGIAMLSGVLRSKVAIQTSIMLMNTFVAMRKTLATMAPVLARIEMNERRQIVDQARNEERFTEIFDAMRDKRFPPQKVFYDGAVFDSDAFVTRHIAKARASILLIDSWVDLATLEMLAKKRKGVSVEVVTSRRGNRLAATDIVKFNAQYGGLSVRTSEAFHDRFLVIDDRELYLVGASLKDLGRKCFGFTKMDAGEIAGLKARISTSHGGA